MAVDPLSSKPLVQRLSEYDVHDPSYYSAHLISEAKAEIERLTIERDRSKNDRSAFEQIAADHARQVVRLRAEVEGLTRQKDEYKADAVGLAGVVSRLRAALTGAVEVIKTWHNMSRDGLRGSPSLEAVWDIYCNAAPEMRPIREALACDETAGRKTTESQLGCTAPETTACRHENFSEYAGSPRICKDCGATLAPLLPINIRE